MKPTGLHLETTFPYCFAVAVTTDPAVVKRMYASKDFSIQEMNFVADCLNILSTALGNVDTLVHSLLEMEIADDASNMLRRNTITTKLLDAFMKRSCQKYLRQIVRDPLAEILNDMEVRQFEIEDVKILQQIQDSVAEQQRKKRQRKGPAPRRVMVSRRTVQRLPPKSKQKRQMDTQMKANLIKLRTTIDRINSCIFNLEAVANIPFELRSVARDISDLASENGIDAHLRIGALVILRMVNPAILFPDKIGLCNRQHLTPNHRRALVLITKAIQALVNDRESKDGAMVALSNEINRAWRQQCVQFLDAVCIERSHIPAGRVELREVRQLELSEDFGVFVDVALLLYYFLKHKGMDVEVGKPAEDIETELEGETATLVPFPEEEIGGRIFFVGVAKVTVAEEVAEDTPVVGQIRSDAVVIKMTDTKYCMPEKASLLATIFELCGRFGERIAAVRVDLGSFDMYGSIGGGEEANLCSPMIVPFDPPDFVECRQLGIVVHYRYVEEHSAYVFCVRELGYFAPLCDDFLKVVAEEWKPAPTMSDEDAARMFQSKMEDFNSRLGPLDAEAAKEFFKAVSLRDSGDVVTNRERIQIVQPADGEQRPRKRRGRS